MFNSHVCCRNIRCVVHLIIIIRFGSHSTSVLTIGPALRSLASFNTRKPSQFAAVSGLTRHVRFPSGVDALEMWCIRSGSFNTHLHTQTHWWKDFKCDLCCLCFSRNELSKTNLQTHSGEKPFKCDLSGVRFSTSGHTIISMSHLLNHTGEKPFKCEVCGLCFAWRDSLKRHMRIHTGEKPFKCDLCELRFAIQGYI